MPYDNVPEGQWPDMDRCVDGVMADGKDKAAAVAICYASIVEGKAFPADVKFSLESMKIGAALNMNNRSRVAEIRKAGQAIMEHAEAMLPTIEPDKEDEPETAKAIVIDLPGVILDWVTVKAGAEEWTLDVLGVPFGGPFNGKDRDKQYFDEKTETFHNVYKSIPAVYGHGLTPDGKKALAPEIVGTASYNHTNERGHWYKVILDKASKMAARLWNAAKNGKARASSGSLSHMVRIDANGHIAKWPVAEMTLVDLDTSNLIPSNPYAVAVPTMKASYHAAGIDYPSENQPEATPQGANPQAGAADKSTKLNTGVIEMDEKELLALLDARDAAKASEAVKAAEAAKIESLKAENEALKEAAAKANRLPGGFPHIAQYADTKKYDNLSAAELGLAIQMQNNLHAKASDRIAAPSLGAIKALALKVARIENDKVSSETEMYAKAGARSVFGDLSDEAIKAATDPATSTGSLIGADWVGTAYSNQIWEQIRAAATVVSRIPSAVIPDGYSSEYFPLESSDPTWYKVAQATASDSTMLVPVPTIPASQMATATKQITVAKMGARALYTGELTEDSIIAYVPQLRAQLAMSGAEMMEHVVIDGDTATSSNINDIGGTTYSGAATSLFLLTNGLRKSPLVTTTTQSRSAAGAFVAEDFLETAKLLGLNGVGYADPTKCGFIVDPNTWFASAKLPEAKDLNQTVFTVEGGFVKRAYLVEVIPSWYMHYRQPNRKANSAGKVDLDTAGNNLYGGILGVRWDQWKLAYKRLMTMETTRIANADTWEIVAMTRWGLGQRDVYASAETYYVGL